MSPRFTDENTEARDEKDVSKARREGNKRSFLVHFFSVTPYVHGP